MDTSRVTVIDWCLVYRYTGEGGDYFGDEALRKDGELYASSRTFSIHFIVVKPTTIAHTVKGHMRLLPTWCACVAGLIDTHPSRH